MSTGNSSLRSFSPSSIGRLRLRNRFIRSAAYEGMCPAGEATEELIAYHRRLAAGGAAMTTVAYAAVTPSARSYERQLCMWKPATVAGLRRLADAVHAEGAAVSLQLAHAGYAANPGPAGKDVIGPSRVFNAYTFGFPRAMSDDDMEEVSEGFARSARSAVESGFDAVEIHAGHGYLLSQFLSPYTNRRNDRWGGSLDNRMRLPLQVIRRVRRAVGSNFPVLVKLNLSDGFRGGLQVAEAVEIAKRFESEGADALVLSGGFMTRTPMYVMRGAVPHKELRRGLDSRAHRLAALLFSRLTLRAVPFTEAYFLDDAMAVREATRLPLVLVGGLRRLDRMEEAVARGFDFLALARPLIMEPDLLRKFETKSAVEARCIPCNRCLASVAKGSINCPLATQERLRPAG